MYSKSLIASLFCAAASAAVLERREQCLTGALASFAPLATVPAAASYCSQSFPVATVTATTTATDFISVTVTLTETVVTTTSTTTTETTTNTNTETITDITTTTTTSFFTPNVTLKRRGKQGHCNTTKKYPTASATSSASASSSATSSTTSSTTSSACPYEALLCDLISETPEAQSKVCSCLQQEATATVTASVTETTSLTEVATATMTTITLFTTTATTLTSTTATVMATETAVVPGVCTQGGFSARRETSAARATARPSPSDPSLYAATPSVAIVISATLPGAAAVGA